MRFNTYFKIKETSYIEISIYILEKEPSPKKIKVTQNEGKTLFLEKKVLTKKIQKLFFFRKKIF